MKQETEIKRLKKLDKVQVQMAGKLKLDIYEVKKVLYHHTDISSIASEVLEGMILINGKTRTFVCFVDGEDFTRTEMFDTAFEAKCVSSCVNISSQVVSAHATILDNELSVANSDEINLKCAIEVNSCVCNADKIVIQMPEDDNLVVKQEEMNIIGFADFGKHSFGQDVSIKVKEEAKDILNVFVSPVVDSVEVKNSVVIVSGRNEIKMVYITNEEEPQIKTVSESQPFNEEIASADEHYHCSFVGNSRSDVDFTNSGNEIKLNIKTEISYQIYNKMQLNMTIDAFSIKNNINLTYSSFETTINNTVFNFKDEVTGNVTLKGEGEIKVLAVIPKEVIVASVYKEDNYIVVEGVSKVNSLYEEHSIKNGETEKNLNSSEIEIPFSIKAKNYNIELGDVSAEVKFAKSEIKQMYSSEARVNIELAVSLTSTMQKTLGYISDASIGEELVQNTNSLSLYIGTSSDTIWNVCKKLRVSKQCLIEQNPEMNPEDLKGQHIIVYRQRTK